MNRTEENTGITLIALIIISALLLMANNISTYKNAEESNVKNSQLAKFNMDFERYLDDKGISGSDIVTLANKVTDYNSKSDTVHDVTNSVDYSIKITLNVDMTGFKNKYGYNRGGIFTDKNYTVDETGGDLKQIIDTYNPIFNGSNKKLITHLTDVYDRKLTENENIKNMSKVANDWERVRKIRSNKEL